MEVSTRPPPLTKPVGATELKKRLGKVGEWIGSGIVGGLALIVVIALAARFIGVLRKSAPLPVWVILTFAVIVVIGYVEWVRAAVERRDITRDLVSLNLSYDGIEQIRAEQEGRLKQMSGCIKNHESRLEEETARSEMRHAWVQATDQLLSSISAIEPREDLSEELKNAIELLLNDCLLTMHQHYGVRAVLFRPDNRELRPWVTYGFDDASFNQMRPRTETRADSEPIGTAGVAYRTKQVKKGYVRHEGDAKWHVDAEQYIHHRGRREPPPYECFICLPIVVRSRCVAVLTLDSATPDLFDRADMRPFTSSLRKKLKLTFTITDKFERISGGSG